MKYLARASVVLVMLLASGCSLVGAVAYKAYGPPKVQPKYKPDKLAAMLVLAENFHEPSAASNEASLIERYVSDELSAEKVAPIIDADKLQALRDERRGDFQKLSIAAIGRELGAKQILYVELTRNSVSPLMGDESIQGEATARVKVIAAQTGQTLWPTDQAQGYEVSAATAVGKDRAQADYEVRAQLARSLASQIARLFHAWQPEDMRPENYD